MSVLSVRIDSEEMQWFGWFYVGKSWCVGKKKLTMTWDLNQGRFRDRNLARFLTSQNYRPSHWFLPPQRMELRFFFFTSTAVL